VGRRRRQLEASNHRHLPFLVSRGVATLLIPVRRLPSFCSPLPSPHRARRRRACHAAASPHVSVSRVTLAMRGAQQERQRCPAHGDGDWVRFGWNSDDGDRAHVAGPTRLPQLLLDAGKHSTPSPPWEKGKRRCRHRTTCSIPFALFNTAERSS